MLGLSVAVVGLWLVGMALAFAVLGLYPDGPWRPAAIASAAVLISGFVVLAVTIVLAVRRRS